MAKESSRPASFPAVGLYVLGCPQGGRILLTENVFYRSAADAIRARETKNGGRLGLPRLEIYPVNIGTEPQKLELGLKGPR